MPRYVIDIRYNGAAYSGWQLQENATTVQGEVEIALQKLLRQHVETYGAGRTDAGVHALKLPTHFDYDGDLHPHFFKAINALLPYDISVMKVYRAVDDNFNVRFAAIRRAYRYQLTFQKDPMQLGFCRWIKEKLDIEAMQSAAKVLFDYNSYESFCKANGNNKTYFCEIKDSRFEWEGDMLVYHVAADRFLRGMVRTIVGTLLMVGKGTLDEAGLRAIIEGKDRRLAGSSEMAAALFLSEVDFPEGSLVELEF